MAAKSIYLDDALLNHVLRNVAMTSPATVYAALFTVAPTPSTSGTEVTGGSYARVATTFGVPASGVSTNSAPVAFPTATANWGTVVAVALFDAAVAGNILYFGLLTTAKAVDNGDTASFAATALSITEQ